MFDISKLDIHRLKELVHKVEVNEIDLFTIAKHICIECEEVGVERFVKLLHRYIDLHPYSLIGWKLMCYVYLSTYSYKQALEAVDFALAIKEADLEAIQLKINCEKLVEAESISKNYGEIEALASYIYLKDKAYDKAIIFYKIAYLLNIAGEYMEAISYLTASLTDVSLITNRLKADIYISLSHSYKNIQQIDLSLAYSTKALDLFPKENKYICEHILNICEIGIIDKAIVYLEDVFSTNDYTAAHILMFAACLYYKKDEKQAYEYFIRAFTQDIALVKCAKIYLYDIFLQKNFRKLLEEFNTKNYKDDDITF